MDLERVESLLRGVAAGDVEVGDALALLRRLPIDDTLDFAQLDTHRALRTGRAEVVFCQGKTPAQCAAIAERLATHAPLVLLTRASPEAAAAVVAAVPQTVHHEAARCLVVGNPPEPDPNDGTVAVVTAGTADIPVAEECAITLACFGRKVERVYDVGVAGLHRVLNRLPVLESAQVVVVVAGMEGALSSVVGGLVRTPVVACPTSIGYGASFGGVSALLTMLNSCAPGIGVVNIDNGYGAACLADRCLGIR
jgi:NCAIR mutase (PurE)-related protein